MEGVKGGEQVSQHYVSFAGVSTDAQDCQDTPEVHRYLQYNFKDHSTSLKAECHKEVTGLFLLFLASWFCSFSQRTKNLLSQESHTSPILFIRKQFVNSVFWIKSP